MTGTLKIIGKLTAGSTVTVSQGTLADTNGLHNLTYEWKSGNTVLSTNSSYILTAADLKNDITVTALYVHEDGTPTTSTSTHIFNHVHTGSVSVNGLTTVGNTLTAVTSLKDADGLGTLNYKWTNSNGDTLGTKMTYKIRPEDNTPYNTISLTVSYKDKANYDESETKVAGIVSVSKQTSSANDVLTSTVNLDKLTGGLGSDTFKFVNAITSGVTDTCRDVITDFNHSQKDKVDLSGIDSFLGTLDNAGNELDSAFTWLSAAPTGVQDKGVAWFDESTSILYASTDTDADPEFSIQLTGVVVFDATDVIL